LIATSTFWPSSRTPRTTSSEIEVALRSEVMTPQEIVRSATLVNAEIVRHAGRLGEITAGAFTDLLVVDGDPYRDLGVFQDEGAHIPAIMKGGRFVKNEL